MKKFLSILLLPLFALVLLCGCGTDRSVADIKNEYLEMITTMQTNCKELFSDSVRPNSIVISYPSMIQEAIENTSYSNDIQKQFRGIYYQQQVLDKIFAYYENNNENFYTKASSADIKKEELNALFDSTRNLKTTVNAFVDYYKTFTSNNVSDMMEFNLISYSYRLNGVIEASFDFINKFHDMNVKYCVENFNVYSPTSLQLYIDKAYVDIAQVVYLENIKAFNYSVGSNGVCDLSGIVGNTSEFNILDKLTTKGNIKATILEGISNDDTEVKNTLNTFCYVRDVFNQRVNSYMNTYNSLDMFNIVQYRFGLNGSVDYSHYLNSLSPSDHALVDMMDKFVGDTFVEYENKLSLIIE